MKHWKWPQGLRPSAAAAGATVSGASPLPSPSGTGLLLLPPPVPVPVHASFCASLAAFARLAGPMPMLSVLPRMRRRVNKFQKMRTATYFSVPTAGSYEQIHRNKNYLL